MNTEEHKEPISIIDTGLQITSFDQLWRVSNMLYQSKLVPSAFRTPEQLMVALLRALELKLPPLQAIEGMTVINNKVGLSGDLALSMVESSGLLEKKRVTYTETEGGGLCCTITIKRKGRDEQSYSFSIAEARAAKIYERNLVWQQYPKRMTYYRALGFALRDEFADVLKGIKTIEELQDYPVGDQSYAELEEKQKIAANQKRDRELTKTLPSGVKIVAQSGQTRPTPEEAAEPAFDEDKIPEEAPVAPRSEEPDELDMSEPEQQTAFFGQLKPANGGKAPDWQDHIILGVERFHKRKVGDLKPAELAVIETKWMPAVLAQWDLATDEQRVDYEAFKKAIESKKVSKPW
jgi:hypothetical protein